MTDWLMPEELTASAYLRMMLMGPAKAGGGKTTTCLVTAPAPVGLMLCENDAAVSEAKRQRADFLTIKYNPPIKNAWAEATNAIMKIRAAAKEKRIKTLVIDPFSELAAKLEEQLLEETNHDGRRAYPVYRQRLAHILTNIFQLEIHIICICHYFESDADKEDMKTGKKVSGRGRFPFLAGSAREKIAGMFNEVVWTEIRNDAPNGRMGLDKQKRVFVTGPDGVWTSGGARSLQGTHVLPADVAALIRTIKDESKRPPNVTPKALAKPYPMNGGQVTELQPPKPFKYAPAVKPKTVNSAPPVRR